MLPELDRSIADIESRLEELEQEDAIWMRSAAGEGPAAASELSGGAGLEAPEPSGP